jgi:hypothetical protein
MRRSVNFDDKPSVEGSEVGDEAAEDNLAPKAKACDLLASKTFPEASFGVCCIPS